ncbi:hypothetical protein C8Q70DRAFT_1025225 [Cubamyces menziesii]|nr:hypothetical protein C8Q70DRAFT_1025225 [Cubamyces menziesii]
MEKPKASGNSRAYKASSRFARSQAQKPQGNSQSGPTRGKKTRACDVGKLTHILDLPCDVFYEVRISVYASAADFQAKCASSAR